VGLSLSLASKNLNLPSSFFSILVKTSYELAISSLMHLYISWHNEKHLVMFSELQAGALDTNSPEIGLRHWTSLLVLSQPSLC